MSYDLTDQRVLVTAASSGIGKATAIAFQSAGAKVAICARNKFKLMETKMQLDSLGERSVLAKVTDLANNHSMMFRVCKNLVSAAVCSS